ncbi:phosphoserine phosphatase SerB [bacterium]|nr:phosphoserine phosphatase SerB [bacterium]
MKQYLLISNTNDKIIDDNTLNYVSSQIEKNMSTKPKYRELSPQKAYEWELFFNKGIKEFELTIKKKFIKSNIDCNFINLKKKDRKKKLLIADMDGTIIQEESLNELAKHLGQEEKIKKITSEAMNGKIDFKKALIERVAILQGCKTQILDNLKQNININDGAQEVIKTMKQNGATTVLVSGGFTFLTDHLKQLLGFNYSHANKLEIIRKNRIKELSGKVLDPILDKNAKRAYLDKYIKEYQLTYDDAICVGDGANDTEMIQKAGLGVSFNGKKVLDVFANIHFKNTNLLGLLYAQGYKDREILN